MTRPEYLDPPGLPPPVGQYSNVAIVPPGAPVAHVAGQLPVDAEGAVLWPGDFARQADLVFTLLAQALEAIGSGLGRVAFLRAFMVSDKDFAGFRDARRRAFDGVGVESPPPATTIVVRGLYGGARIELDAIATLEPIQSR